MRFSGKNISRKKFIKYAIASIFSIEILYVLIGVLKKHKGANDHKDLFCAGDVASFESNNIYPFSSGHFYLSRIEDGGFLAISTKCTHLGCTVQYSKEPGKFICPCHASSFNKYGEVLSPPATRALNTYPVTIENNKVYVDISEPIKRKEYNQSQLIYA